MLLNSYFLAMVFKLFFTAPHLLALTKIILEGPAGQLQIEVLKLKWLYV